MKKLFYLLPLFFILFCSKSVFAQAEDILYICESFSNGKEVGISDRFTSGKLTVMVKLVNPIYYKSISIVLNKYNCSNGKFEYFFDKTFEVESSWTYIHFDALDFSAPGLFRVFLIDPNNNTIVSNLVEIIK